MKAKEKNYSIWLLWEEEEFPLIPHLHTDPSLSSGTATKLINEYGTVGMQHRVSAKTCLTLYCLWPLYFL